MTISKKTPPERERIVRCPACGGRSVYAASNPYRPFCSARCKNHDFGAWAAEGYRIDAAQPDEGDRPDGGTTG